MRKKLLPVWMLLSIVSATATSADQLTEIIQKDLVALGYDPGNISGELSTETIVAITKFEAENSLEITGEPSPQLAGVIKAKLRSGNDVSDQSATPTVAPAATATAPAPDPAALQAAQQACLQKRVEEAQASKKKKRGFGSLVRAVANTASRFGGNELTRQIAESSRDVYDVNATAQDWERAAEDLGLTTDDIEACRNPVH